MFKVCFKEELPIVFANKNIILIGAGKQAERLLKEYNWNILYLVDNDVMKHDTTIEINKKSYVIKDWQYLEKQISSNDILLITPCYYYELMDMVTKSQALKDNDCYIYAYINELQWDVERIKISAKPFCMTKNASTKIPKIIHYFWFSDDPYPEKVQKCIDSWKKFCPDYEIKKWDLSNYHTDNDFANEALEKKCWAAASDFGRFDVVYRYGGIYLDTDVEVLKPLDDLLYDNGFMCFESSNGVDPGSGFGAVAGNCIIEDIRNSYYGIHFERTEEREINVNIIQQTTNVLQKYGFKKNGAFQKINDFVVYPPLVLSPYSYMTGITIQFEKTYAIHHWVSAWITDKRMQELNLRKKIMQENIKPELLKKFLN